MPWLFNLCYVIIIKFPACQIILPPTCENSSISVTRILSPHMRHLAVYLFRKDNWMFIWIAGASTHLHVLKHVIVHLFLASSVKLLLSQPIDHLLCHTLVLQNLKCVSKLYLPWNRTILIKHMGGLNKYFGLFYLNKTYAKWKMVQGQFIVQKRNKGVRMC
jgi:hypothetical protein